MHRLKFIENLQSLLDELLNFDNCDMYKLSRNLHSFFLPGPHCQAEGVLRRHGQGQERHHLLQRVARLRHGAHHQEGRRDQRVEGSRKEEIIPQE